MTTEVLQKTILSMENTKKIRTGEFQIIHQIKFLNKLINWFNLNRNQFKWSRIISIFTLHALFAYSILTHAWDFSMLTVIWSFLMTVCCGLGVTAGAHRLWTHRSYKVKPQLQILLLIFFSMSGENDVFEWVRDHRVHHKFSDTEADPHNARRGFFFSHCGWLMMRKSPQVIEKGRQIDMSDITNDPYITWHTKYFIPLQIVFCHILPTIVPVYLWNETWLNSFFAMNIIRYAMVLNSTWSVNSFAHIWGSKPYNKQILPAENLGVAIMSIGEGWHNYHHVFPWDYKTGEYGRYKPNFTKTFIDFMARIGWAYDLKEPSEDLVRRVLAKHGKLLINTPEQPVTDS